MNKRKLSLIIILLIVIIIIIFLELNKQNKKKSYEIEKVTEYKYFLLYEDDKVGVINDKGNILIDPIYDSIQIPNPSKDVFICLYDYYSQTEDYKVKVLNAENKEIFTKYDKVLAIQLNGIANDIPYEKSALIYEKDGKYGLINFEGKILTKAIYDEIQGLTYKEGELLVKKGDKFGVINVKGAQIIKPEYNSIIADNYYDEENKYKFAGYIVSKNVNSNYNYGYIKYNGKMLLKPEYTSISRIIDINDTENIYLIVQNMTKYGLVKNKDIIVNLDYKQLDYNEDNNIIIARKNAKSGILDLQGKEIISIDYDELSINGIYVYTKKDNEEKYFDINGNEIQNQNYKSIFIVDNEKYYIFIDENSLYGILDKNKEILLESKYSYIEYLFDDYFIAYNNNLGVIDSKGNKIIDFKYDVLNKINNSNIIQAKNMSKNTTELFSKNIESIGIYNNAIINEKENYIEILYDGGKKYLDLNGKILENTEVYKNNKLFALENNGKWGFKNSNGNIVINCIYDEVTEFNEYGFAGIKKDNKWGVIDINSNIILEPIYELNNEPFFIDKYYRVYQGYGSIYYTNKGIIKD